MEASLRKKLWWQTSKIKPKKETVCAKKRKVLNELTA